MKNQYSEIHPEAGTDEAGRGCLAGPVTAAAVILPPDFSNDILTDSKQLSKKNRDQLRTIIEKEAICYAVVHTSPEEIDQMNILNASIESMHRALKALSTPPKFIAVDGNKFKPFGDVPYECVVKGDGKYLNIAAASILAKTYRDELMEELDKTYPQYDWKKNKGYPTKTHRAAIVKHGTTPHHRKSFRLIPDQLSLDL
ncbi:ribonuclease HII [Robertkochia sediminum]|uniref:ribonuclease HII n=1 Tax=Robertkochia sediminum TaxID=2785326 RepID=UPI0019324530|nr:ribonuclease HII [Robertkochia sediminum]MBL7472873.1 ribonuclease HII [Robertkochia sediminum]